ncbi:MAG: tetratricopeptide repeat protein, partial [Myxococcales bacterium]|nr:tetratricopeptide repeat protein [Myxococcales bacterium]
RLTELVELDTVRGSAKDGFRWIRIIGESGSGKTRLLAELAERYRARGDAVAGAGPHRSGAPVPYAAWRRIFSELLHVSADALEGQMDALTKSDGPLARAGLEEVLGAAGLRGMDGADRSGAVAAAFAAIVRRAVQVAPSHQVAVFLDDIGRCDGLSQKVLRHLPELLGEASLLLVTTDVIKGGVVPGSETIELKGLTGDEIAEFTGAPAGSGTAAAPPGLGRRRLLPLYLEQLQRLTRDGAADEALPPRLADAVGQRVDALPMAARLTLQAASVLGDRCQLEELMRVAQLETTEAITVLSREGLLRMSGDCLEVAHPFLRDLVEASIPAEARRELHQRALELFSSRGAPLEVRAEHAYRAGEPMSALMLLERMGDTAIERGDGGTAVLAFRRALELARREMLESGDAAMDTALVTFSRKLGVALAGSGDVGGADGVLREALDLTGPKSPDRSRLLLELAKVAAQRGRRRDAMRMLGQALERVADGHDPASEARVQICLGKVRRDEGEVVGAANAYRQAVELLDEVDAPQLERARTRLELGRVLLEQGHSERAIPILEEASRLAAEAEGLALQAAILGALGTIAHQAADLATAQIRYGEAARLAAEAGDAEGARLWEEAGAS